MLKQIILTFNRLSMIILAGLALLTGIIFTVAKIESLFNPIILTLVICGIPIVYTALAELWQDRHISSELLISIAMLASIAIGELLAAAEVAFIMAIGELLEDYTVAKANKGIQQLINLVPLQARVIRDNNEYMADATSIAIGEQVRILPGETIPVDGKVIQGNSSVDQAIITGESLPIDKQVGDAVFCGTTNCLGTLEIIATASAQDSSLQKMINLVKQAEQNQAPMQRIADQWATWLVPAAMLIAIITYILSGNLTHAVTVLIVFCPCALALATPTAIMAAIGQATKQGVLIKSGQALETMGTVNCLAFDKTGTLTTGKLTVTEILSFQPELSQNQLLTIAASLESLSEHPLGKAIVAKAKTLSLKLQSVTDFQMQAGKGISAKLAQQNFHCGNLTYLQEYQLTLPTTALERVNTLRNQGKAVIFVATDTEIIGSIALADTIRNTATTIVEYLHTTGVKTVLLTGDHFQTAKHLATQLAIDTVYAELLPVQKVDKIQELQAQGNTLCMVGDGVNDAPALKIANVGIAMGSIGSDIAIEAADIALMGDDISKLAYVKKLATYTLHTIKLNIALSMLINVVAIIFSVMGWLNPITGALVHNGGAILVILNAVHLYDRKFI